MSIKKQLPTITQEGNSCMIVSYSIILNYYSKLSSGDIILFFLNAKKQLISEYIQKKDQFDLLSPQGQYNTLYKQIARTKYHFNNGVIENTLKPLSSKFHVTTRIVDIKEEIKEITTLLLNAEACLSLSCLTPYGWHVTPVAYYQGEFHTIINGIYCSLGADFNEGIRTIFSASDIGDGILFIRSK